MDNPFVWLGVEHELQLAYTGDQYFGWFDITIGVGVMREEGFLTFNELVIDWQSEMRNKN